MNLNYNIYILIALYSFNLIKNILDYDKVFLQNDNNINCPLHTAYIIKFFILTLFQFIIIYLLFNNSENEAKPLILISYGIAIPLYTIEYMNKIYQKDNNKSNTETIQDIVFFIIQCITSTLAIYIIWSKKSLIAAVLLILLTSIIMLLPFYILKYNNTNCINNHKKNNNADDKIKKTEQSKNDENKPHKEDENIKNTRFSEKC